MNPTRPPRALVRIAATLLMAICLMAASPAESPSFQGDPATTSAPAVEDAAGAPPEAGALGGIGAAQRRMTEEAKSLFTHPGPTLKRWVLQDGPRVLGKIFLFFLILLAAKVVAGFVGRIVRRGLDKSARGASALFKNFVESAVTKVVFFTGLVLALQNIGLNVAPLIAGLGVMGFIVGFALQDTLGNFAAGIMLLLYRPYDVGDYVSIAGQDGTVESMTLVSTTLLTVDNQRLTVPNGKIWGNVIRNTTANTMRRMSETIGIGYGDDIAHAEEVAMGIVSKLEHVAKEPAPQVLVTSLGDSSVELSVRAWVPTGEYFGSCCELRRSLKLGFDREGITIPFPQRDVHLIQGARTAEPAGT